MLCIDVSACVCCVVGKCHELRIDVSNASVCLLLEKCHEYPICLDCVTTTT